MGAHLVKIDNAREMAFIQKKLTESSWLGLNDRGIQDHWVWQDQESAMYTNWALGKPEHSGETFGKHCAVVLTGDAKGLWSNVECSQERAYICEKKTGLATTPGGTSLIPLASIKCGLFWEDDPLSDFCYQFNTNTLSWSEALLQCQHNGGELASVASLEEQQYVAGRAHTIPDMRYFWLGASALGEEDGWIWSDGNPFAFLNWGADMIESRSNARCMEMDALSGSWLKEECQNRRGYVCKKKGNVSKATPIPVNTTTTPTTPGYPSCSGDWARFGRHCYKTFEDQRTWTSAKNTCRRQGGDLVSILNEDENNFVSGFAGGAHVNPVEVWTGLNDRRIVNQFEWTDDSTVTFTRWQSREPNNHLGKELCVSLYTTGTNTGKWQDADCAQLLPYICKKPATIITSMDKVPPVWQRGCSELFLRIHKTGALGVHKSEYDENLTGANRGSCYIVSEKGASWSDARHTCNSTGGTLLTINDQVEQAYISAKLSSMVANSEYWIGLSNVNDGIYVWDSDTRVLFTNWDKKHTGNDIDRCVAITKSPRNTGEWSGRACSETIPFICEYSRGDYATTTPAPTTPPPAKCPNQYSFSEYGDFCYKMEYLHGFRKRTWFEAIDHCKMLGGELASFHSEAQLKGAIRTQAGRRDPYWIGLSRPSKDSGYTWVDRTAVDFVYWAAGEPNDHNGQESCVELDRSSGRWYDSNCYARRSIICQFRKGDPIYNTKSTIRPTPAPQCGSDEKWRAHKDHCYFLSSGYGVWDKTWHDARKYCMQNGGNLASVHDLDENNFLMGETSKWYPSEKLYWIGLNELDLESYKWSDGTPTNFISWDVGEPNDFEGGEKCVSYYALTGHWVDENCGLRHKFICKRHKDSSTTATPTPTTPRTGTCPPGFEGPIGNKCYFLQGTIEDSNTLKNWSNALSACPNNATLASVTNAMEAAFLATLLKDKFPVDFWIGLKKYSYQKYKWIDNFNVEFVYWDNGEPRGWDDCISVSSASLSAGGWRVRDCNLRLGYVCQAWIDTVYPTPLPSLSPSHCPLGYSSFGDACYQVTSHMTWEQAKATCERRQDTLVSVTDGFEQAFVVLLTQKERPEPIWLGLTRKGAMYYWLDGWPVDYINWESSEPTRGDMERCVALMPNGRWNDTDCSAEIKAVCKRTTATAPSTVVNPPGTCFDDKHWFGFGAYCYLIDGKKFGGWATANFDCYKHGASLASVESQAEMDFLMKMITQERANSRDLWLGLWRKPDGSFVWHDKTPFNYANWLDGEPSTEARKECVQMSPETGKWKCLLRPPQLRLAGTGGTLEILHVIRIDIQGAS
ncbi:macrophage mannose receptor 1-like [Lingula anatina]|uniref:Macrophage mannose receptor 1-like n=1 Tax=Lingula anatina TaxID=7574 RepID=A0A1S3HM73_LINAN|nr:macrophage mannose receptor 1-like [Lingula anatina]|eukprot:XP_013387112.2 macrophage mannose receptor 1-like [Lingula anatina]